MSEACDTPEGHSGEVTALAYWDQTVRLWDPSTGKACCTLKGHWEGFTAVAFSPDGQLLDGRLLVSASHDKTANVIGHPNTQALLYEGQSPPPYSYRRVLILQGALEGYSEAVTAVAFSPNGQLETSIDRRDSAHFKERLSDF
jgi:WD40 repeat protein